MRSLLALIVCFFFSQAVFADVTYTVTFGGVSVTSSTVASAASSVASQLTAKKNVACVNSSGSPLGYTTFSVLSVNGLVVQFRATYGGNCNIAPFDPAPVMATQNGLVTCPSNQELDPDTHTCECKSIPNAGSHMVTGDVFQGCNSGCSMLLQSGWYDKTANTTFGNWSQTGSVCTAGEPSVLSANDPKVEAAKQCTPGTCPGTVNGQSVCVPCDKSKETGTGTKTESSSTTASGASTPGASSTSSESTSTRTECSNGSCTTSETTTVTGPNGDKTEKTTNTTEPQSDYCTRNPKADVCKGTESSWGGSCESGFTCDGDAVQCAQARASYELRCKITETDSEVIGKYNALKAEGLEGLHLPAMNITPPTPEAFGACPIQDVTIDLGFGPMPFPLSYVCPYLEVIHRVVTSFGALFWLLIVFLKGD